MSNSTVALDLDSTTAATCDVSFELLEGPNHGMGYEDIEAWDWGLEKYGTARYLSAIWHAWTLRPHKIQPMEPEIVSPVRRLHDEFGVDVVTNHPDHMGISESKEEWLQKQGIPYNELVSVPMGESKGQYGYDFYIDDKPVFAKNVPSDSTLFLRDQRYNRSIDTEIYDNVYRVQTVKEAADKIIEENHEQ